MIGIGPYIEHGYSYGGYSKEGRDEGRGRKCFRRLRSRRNASGGQKRCEAGARQRKSRRQPAGKQRGFTLCLRRRGCRTLRLLSILRLMFLYALLPSTTALGTIHPGGRDGAESRANVVMLNLSPAETRELYALYENKNMYRRRGGAEQKPFLEQSVSGPGIVSLPRRGM